MVAAGPDLLDITCLDRVSAGYVWDSQSGRGMFAGPTARALRLGVYCYVVCFQSRSTMASDL